MEQFVYDLPLASSEWAQAASDWAHALNLVIQILIVVAFTYLIYHLRHLNERLAGQVFSKDVQIVRTPSDVTTPLPSPLPLRVNTQTRATPSMSDIRRTIDILCRGMVVPVAVSDSRGVLLEVNNAACKLFGYQHSELIGRGVEKLMPSDIARIHSELMRLYVYQECGGNLSAAHGHGPLGPRQASGCPFSSGTSPKAGSVKANKNLVGQGKVVGEGRVVRALHRDGKPIDIHLSVNTVTLSDDPEGLVFVATFQDLTVLNNAMDAHKTALEVSRRHNSMTKVFKNTMPVSLLENLVEESADHLAQPKQELRRAHLHRHDDVCIAFFDIFGFSKYCASTPAEEVANRVHTMFSLLDTKCAKHGIEKIRTIGDGYLATAGVFKDYSLMHPTAKESISEEIIRRSLSVEPSGANHGPPSNSTNGIEEVRGHFIQTQCVDMFLFALEAITESKQSDMMLRVGLHRGGVLSGIVGQVAAQFDIFGHNANYSARLEQHCEPGCIHVSEHFYKALQEVIPEALREIEVETLHLEFKNIGAVDTVMVKPPFKEHGQMEAWVEQAQAESSAWSDREFSKQELSVDLTYSDII